MSDDRDDDEVVTGGPVELWALPRAVQVLRWVGGLALLVVIGVAVHHVVVDGVRDPVLGAGLVALILLVRMARAVVAVYLDTEAETLTLFRTVGPALETRPEHIRRLDRGLFEQSFGSVWTRAYQPRRSGVRIVADEGAATLSVLFPEDTVQDLAQALLDHDPDHLAVEL